MYLILACLVIRGLYKEGFPIKQPTFRLKGNIVKGFYVFDSPAIFSDRNFHQIGSCPRLFPTSTLELMWWLHVFFGWIHVSKIDEIYSQKNCGSLALSAQVYLSQWSYLSLQSSLEKHLTNSNLPYCHCQENVLCMHSPYSMLLLLCLTPVSCLVSVYSTGSDSDRCLPACLPACVCSCPVPAQPQPPPPPPPPSIVACPPPPHLKAMRNPGA